jgi:GNAT superfamily N-acetyltransferase
MALSPRRLASDDACARGGTVEEIRYAESLGDRWRAEGALPAYRGQGAGTALLEALIQHARGTYAGLSLSVRNSNPAVRLYERFGFHKVPGSEVRNRVGGYSCTMVLHLA